MVKRLIGLFLLCAWGPPAQATLTRQLNLDDLIGQADGVFLARAVSVTENRRVPDGYPELVTTFAVEETYKGSVPKTFVMRQIGKIDPRSRLNLVLGTTHFRVGDRFVLFAGKENAKGRSGPIGKEQGVFRVSSDGTIANRFGNRGLFRGIPDGSMLRKARARGLAPGDGAIPLRIDDLKELIAAREGKGP
jgi:hypothetical protein